MRSKCQGMPWVLTSCCLLLLAGCAGVSKIELPPERYAATLKDFVPIDPLPSETISYTKRDGTKAEDVPWMAVPTATIRALLPNQEATMTMRKIAADGQVKYLVASATGEVGTYDVLMDYVQYRVEDVVNSSGKIVGVGRVGIGLRIRAQVITTKVGIDLGSLLAVGVAAKLGFISGKLSVAVLGVNSPEVTMLFPTPSDINETSIQRALEALAAIKSKIGDDKTDLTPQVVALKITDEKAFETSEFKQRLK